MKFPVILVFSLLLPILLLSGAWILRSRPLQPEATILGRWKEVSWNYVKADRSDAVSHGQEPFSKAVKHLISSAKLIHKAEIWDFHPSAKLELHQGADHLNLDWSIVGNGNVLRIRYNEAYEETYQLVELSERRMVLHFESERLTRGIVRIVFSKT